MKEIKAYVRPEQVEQVVRALRDAGVPHMTVTHVRSLGSGVDPEQMRISLETGGWYTETATIEFVCAERDVDRLVLPRPPQPTALASHPVDRFHDRRIATDTPRRLQNTAVNSFLTSA